MIPYSIPQVYKLGQNCRKYRLVSVYILTGKDARDMLKLSLETMKNGDLLNSTAKIILASNSPRRKELLALFGMDYSIQPADVDETPQEGESPGEYVSRLAKAKASSVGNIAGKDSIIIAADTTVADGHMLLENPIMRWNHAKCSSSSEIVFTRYTPE